MEIKIIDRDFNFLGLVDEYASFMHTKKWHGIGRFELHLHENATNANKLQKENIMFTAENKAYIILHREANSADGKLVIKGLELKAYLKRWLVFPPEGQAYYRVNSNAETIMKEYVTATLARKGITNIAIAPNQSRGMSTVYQSRYKNLADELKKLSLASGLGWDIRLDLENKQFVFDVTEGQDRTAEQDSLPPAIFSIEYDNVAEQRLVDSKLNYSNVAVVAGQGQGADREIVVIGNADGLDSFELFVDARDLESANDLPARGEQKLAEMQEVFSFDSQVLADKNLIYEEDFNLGDLVTVQNSKWDVATDRRITEVTEIYESTGFRLDVVFGESIPTLIDLVKKATDAPIAEGGSEGEPGLPGQDGNDGVSIEYQWNGTQLGVKREDEVNYQYADLKGPKGEQGPKGDKGDQGIPGLDGKSLEFHWNGTQLGIRVEGETAYQYVNLKGDKGDKGDTGPKGDKGDKGEQGIRGEIGPQGPQGKSIEYSWNGTQLGIRVEGETSYQYVDLRGPQGERGLKGDKGDKGDQGIQGEKGDKGDKGDTGPPGSDANVTNANVINAIGYTPVNKAGDNMTGALSVEHTAFPVVDITRNTSGTGGNVYGGARMVRKTTNPTNGVGIGFYFQAPNSNKVITHAGMFGGALGTIAAGSERGEIVFGPSYAGQDPYTRRDFVIRAISASKAEAELNGKLKTDQTLASDSNDTVATKGYVDSNAGSGGTKVVTSSTEPLGLSTGDQWHREY